MVIPTASELEPPSPERPPATRDEYVKALEEEHEAGREMDRAVSSMNPSRRVLKWREKRAAVEAAKKGDKR